MATELENLVPEADVEVEGMRGPKGDKGDSYVLTEADKEEIAQKVDKIIDAETDKTLTLSGKPADAKAAGDEINDLKADLNDNIQSMTDFISGARNNKGVITSNSRRCTSSDVFALATDDKISVKNIVDGLQVVIAASNGVDFVYDSGWQSSSFSHLVSQEEDGCSFFVNIRKSNEASISPSEVASINVTMYRSKIRRIDKQLEGLADIEDRVEALEEDGGSSSVYVEMYPIAVANNYRINNANGLGISTNDYELLKYAVSEGDIIKVKSDDRFQFQNAIAVPTASPSNRVGETYEVYDGVITVPTGATHLILSTPKTDSAAKVYIAEDMADAIGNVATIYNYTDLSLLENNMWFRTTGVATNTVYWCRSRNYLPDDISSVYTDNVSLSIYLQAWNSDDNYIGVWNNGSWVQAHTAIQNSEFNIEEFRKAYPTYKYKISINLVSGSGEGICADTIYKDIIFQKKITIVEKMSNQDSKIESFADVTETEYSSDTIWISGTYKSDTGVFDSTNKWMHTPKGTIDNILSVRCTDSNLLMWVMGFNQDDEYLGYYTEGGFTNTFNTANAKASWDLLTARIKYPTCTFVLVVRNVNASVELVPVTLSGAFYFTQTTSLRSAIEQVARIQIKESIDEAVEEIKGSAAVTNKVRICEWNIGHFANGSNQSSTITSADYETKRLAFRQYLNDIKADIIGLSEYSAVFCPAESSNAKDDIFGNYKSQYEGPQIRFSCNALFSDIGIKNPTKIEYECNKTAEISQSGIEATDYYYVESTIELGSDTVTLIMTHCAFDNNNPQIASDQYAELIVKYANTAKIIIMGDFNWQTVDQLDVFTNAGYVGANNDWLGSIPTYPGNSKGLDCIYVKGVQIANIEVYSTQLSDHYAIACDVTV